MSLLSTWTKNNRVVTEELTTTYTRTLLGDYGKKYFRYTRTRTKRYEYIGLTESAAKSCAESMRKLYSRRTLTQEWYDAGTAPNASSCWRFVTGEGSTDRSATPTSTFVTNVTNVVMAGTAVAEHVSGDAWKVTVDVNEVLSHNYRPIGSEATGAPVPWSAFESNPDTNRSEFCGAVADYNENYDTADNGYGSPTT